MKKALILSAAGVVIVLGLALWLVAQFGLLTAFPNPAGLPTTEPMPPYAVVYPKPEQTVHLSEPNDFIVIESDDPTVTTFNIPVQWEPGYVCVVLTPVDFLQVGDSWDTKDIVGLSSLSLNSREIEMVPEIVDGLVGAHIQILETSADGTEHIVGSMSVAGGPYGMCWKGPKRAGYYVAEFRFHGATYSWWYEIDGE